MDKRRKSEVEQDRFTSELGTFSWFWQSDADPWKEQDKTKWEWTAYPNEISHLIEESFLSKQRLVDLGNYQIDLKEMIQINKNDRNKMRRIKREINNDEESRLLIELPAPVQKDEKTINEAFGNVQHFLNYIMKRTQEANKLYQRLKDLSLDSDKVEYMDIVDEVIKCIQKGAEAREQVLKIENQNPLKNPTLEAEQIAEDLVTGTSTLRDFLRNILKIYTMESFVCYYINELLRNEDWQGLNVLTPYLVCLTYLFQIQEYTIQFNKGMKEDLFRLFHLKKLVLYRGAALAEEHLKRYIAIKDKYFSWNGVTSTSRSKQIAIRFINMSLDKAKKQAQTKIGVLFKIKVAFSSTEDREGMIDVSSFSKFPNEREVILTPGTVFHLTRIKITKNNLYKIELTIKKKFKQNHEKFALLGNLQKKVILDFDQKAVLNNLPRHEIIKALQLLEGNRFVRKLEINNCYMDLALMELIESTRLSTNLEKEDIELVDNEISIDCISLLYYYYAADEMNNICIANRVFIRDEKQNIKIEVEQQAIKKIFLKLERLVKLQEEARLEDFLQILCKSDETMHLDLNVSSIKYDKNHEKIMANCLHSARFFKKLSLDFSRCSSLESNILEDTSKALITMQNLVCLNLTFKECDNITKDGLNDLKAALKRLTSLQSFSLCFRGCKQISNNGLNMLGNVLLTSLTHLTLDFGDCCDLSDDGFTNLTNFLKGLSSLQHLALSFDECSQISDIALDFLKEALCSFLSLQYLDMNFKKCTRISDSGLCNLSQALKSLRCLQCLALNLEEGSPSDIWLNNLRDVLLLLTSLQNFTLNLNKCKRVSDTGLEYLFETFRSLTSLQYLSLHFYCLYISDQGLKCLGDSLMFLTSLKNFYLHCRQSGLSDDGVNYLSSALKLVKTLQNLSLSFEISRYISDASLFGLKEALLHLKKLESFYLSLKLCKISHHGIINLKDGLKSLLSLKSLAVDFNYNPSIFEDGVNSLIDILPVFKSLISLSLDFGYCAHITNSVLANLKGALKWLLSLEYLSLSFEVCMWISDDGLKSLEEGIKPLKFLKHLSLNFFKCKLISSNGIKYISEALKFLTPLLYVNLNFKNCKNIKEDGWNHLLTGLKSLTSLQDLSVEY